MKILGSSFIFLICLAGAAWAAPAPGPGPEISAGVLGMSFAAGLVYLINRRKGS